MEIMINGEKVKITADIDNIAKLIEHLDLKNRRFFIVEKNREVVKKEDYTTTAVVAGDQFEIVHFVGGG
ncbi:thiamine biosynthesis protein ThiS [Ignatzschineria sp. F8392]|uniref:sulfur carrier protein ThiS n=1 Tax=Ignatzschineria sp. F8392 TaxID=1980117 RepID=UPI000B9905DE|nr:sulfur carrier protein ThiS [Ignatzschineria sp. F8392]OYQ81189.1 thiamine biosynthesis protein ThiS [Ignatzschineria sp. F8392]